MIREALVVGINRYPFLKQNKYGDLDLNAPAADAQAIASLLEKYGDFRVQVLPEIDEGKQRFVDTTATVKLDELQTAIANLFNPPDHRPPDVALLFFAGHGWLTQTGGIEEGFLVTSNTSLNPKTHSIRNGISLRWLWELLQESSVKQQMVWLDCCFSGKLLNFKKSDPGTGGKSDPDRCLIASSRSFQTSREGLSGQHGIFTGNLLAALNPENHVDGWVTNYALVEKINQRMAHTIQCPVFHNSGGAIILTTKGIKPAPDESLKEICPYRSLSYFTEKQEDAVFFHGRTRLTDELIDRVRTDHFIALLGASGSGKSSVLRAGLLYQLKRGQKISGSDRWHYIEPFTPGEHPVERFREKIASVIARQNRQSIHENALLKKGGWGDQSSPEQEQEQTEGLRRRSIIIIDQFEECFTMCQDEAERKQFFAELLALLEDPPLQKGGNKKPP